MRAVTFVREIFKKYPRLFITNAVLAIFLSLVEICALFTIGPLIDFLIHPDLKNISPLTESVIRVMDSIGLPITLGAYLSAFAVFIVLSSSLRIFVICHLSAVLQH